MTPSASFLPPPAAAAAAPCRPSPDEAAGEVPAGALVFGAVAVAAGVLVVAVAARSSEIRGAAAGMGAGGVSALLTGIVVTAVSWRRRQAGRSGESARALLGLACMLWGTGQLLLAAQTAATGARTFGIGDIVSTAAAPVVALGLLRMPRRSRASKPGVRLTLDTLLLTAVATLVGWWWVLEPAASTGPGGTSGAASAVLTAFGDLVVVALTLLVMARESRPGVFALFTGCVLQATADILSLPTVLAGSLIPWQSGALWCVAWPVVGIGMSRIRTDAMHLEPESVFEDLGESRSTTITTLATIAGLTAVLGTAGPARWSGVGGVLLAVTIGMLVARELFGGGIRNRLVSQLGVEALRDVQTGLPNRRALTSRIRALDLSCPWVLLTIDLDGFKEVNDLLGHQAGDELIVGVAATLSAHSPSAGMVARIGGDEFAVLAPGDTASGERLAERLAGAIRTSPATRRDGITLSASIGVGRVLPEVPDEPDAAGTAAGGSTPSTGGAAGVRHMPVLLEARHDRLTALVECAAAVQAAKAAGRDRIAVYPGAVEDARQRRLVLEWRLREALGEGLLTMHAQPLVDLYTGRTRGFESLARWTDAVLGPVSPAEFVPVAEQTGLVTTLGDFALRSTLEQAIAGGLLGTGIEIGVNVSPIQLRLPNFAARVSDLVAELGLPPEQLLLEVTEAILVDDDDSASGALAQLSDAGIRLAIDDFGTGYSALGYLRRLPLDILKIDRSWVVAAVTDTRTRQIVSGVINLAHQLGASVVMEGVEDIETADVCRDLGADIGQGWLFGRPEPWPAAAATLLASRVPAVPVSPV